MIANPRELRVAAAPRTGDAAFPPLALPSTPSYAERPREGSDPMFTLKLVAVVAVAVALVALASLGAGWKWRHASGSQAEHVAGWTWDGWSRHHQ
jgi:hypothetical protein